MIFSWSVTDQSIGRILIYPMFTSKFVAVIMQIELQVSEPTGRIESREIVYNFLFNLRKLRLARFKLFSLSS